MGNSQKPNQNHTLDLDQNTNLFLNSMVLLNIQTSQQTGQNQPIPPTPSFKQDRMIPKTQHNSAYSLQDEDKRKKEIEFQNQLKHQQTQIKKAKFSYESKRLQNVDRIQEIQTRKQNCIKIYQDYDSLEASQDDKERKDQPDDMHTVLLWGNRINLKKYDSQHLMNKYKYPKDNNNIIEKYRNWKIYKKKILEEKINEMQAEEDKIKTQENQLKLKYLTLVDQRQARLNSSVTYLDLKLKQSQITAPTLNSPVGDPKKKQQTSLNNTFSPSFDENFFDQSQSAIGAAENLEPSRLEQNQKEINLSYTLQSLKTEFQNKNPQNLHPQNSQNDFLAKQIFYYQMYTMKKRSSFIYQKDDAQLQYFGKNQYPSRRSYQRPVRCQEDHENNLNLSMSKAKKKKKKPKQIFLEKTPGNFDLQTSVYQKVYEKLPIKQKTKMMYSKSQGIIKEVQNFYPWDDQNGKNQQNLESYPQTMKVNDGIRNSPSKDVQQFVIRPKQKPDGKVIDAIEFQSNQNKQRQIPRQNNEVLLQKRRQRNYEARLLQKVKQKHL